MPANQLVEKHFRKKKYIDIFISHNSKDTEISAYYRELLLVNGFTVLEYSRDSRAGGRITEWEIEHINRCHFFIILISEYSLQSEPMARELGLALKVQKQNGGYRPWIIPVFCETKNSRPAQLDVQDYKTGRILKPFQLGVVRGLDKLGEPVADSDDRLLDLLTPRVTRLKDIYTFYSRNVFRLYRDIFPDASERANESDLIHWVTSEQNNLLLVRVGNIPAFDYHIDSHFYILELCERAIGLAYVDYDYNSNLAFGNYLAIEKNWRAGALANRFSKAVNDLILMKHKRCRGLLFEVEQFSPEQLHHTIALLERTKRKKLSPGESDLVRRFLRIYFYQISGSTFFVDQESGSPISCRSPCLDVSDLPVEEWESHERDYWLMWWPRRNCDVIPDISSFLREAIEFIYVTIITQSAVQSNPRVADEYWRYAMKIVDENLEKNSMRPASFGTFLKRSQSDLFERWCALKIDLPI